LKVLVDPQVIIPPYCGLPRLSTNYLYPRLLLVLLKSCGTSVVTGGEVIFVVVVVVVMGAVAVEVDVWTCCRCQDKWITMRQVSAIQINPLSFRLPLFKYENFR